MSVRLSGRGLWSFQHELPLPVGGIRTAPHTAAADARPVRPASVRRLRSFAAKAEQSRRRGVHRERDLTAAPTTPDQPLLVRASVPRLDRKDTPGQLVPLPRVLRVLAAVRRPPRSSPEADYVTEVDVVRCPVAPRSRRRAKMTVESEPVEMSRDRRVFQPARSRGRRSRVPGARAGAASCRSDAGRVMVCLRSWHRCRNPWRASPMPNAAGSSVLRRRGAMMRGMLRRSNWLHFL
jgi:hypothetical protein